MRIFSLITVVSLLIGGNAQAGDKVLFKDDFKGKLAQGWTWLRPDPSAWRLVKTGGLEIRVQPGNMWGPENDAKNVLVRPVPAAGGGAFEVSVTVANQPSHQWEQVDLVWYYDQSNMVKIGFEQVDGVLSLVMGREENDKTRTLAKLPVKAKVLDLRLTVSGDSVRGQFRPAGDKTWTDAGECTLPTKGPPQVSLQTYRGPPDAEHWARFSGFRIVRSGVAPAER